MVRFLTHLLLLLILNVGNILSYNTGAESDFRVSTSAVPRLLIPGQPLQLVCSYNLTNGLEAIEWRLRYKDGREEVIFRYNASSPDESGPRGTFRDRISEYKDKSNTRHSFTILKADMCIDSGVYTCQVWDQKQTIMSSLKVPVDVFPPKLLVTNVDSGKSGNSHAVEKLVICTTVWNSPDVKAILKWGSMQHVALSEEVTECLHNATVSYKHRVKEQDQTFFCHGSYEGVETSLATVIRGIIPKEKSTEGFPPWAIGLLSPVVIALLICGLIFYWYKHRKRGRHLYRRSSKESPARESLELLNLNLKISLQQALKDYYLREYDKIYYTPWEPFEITPLSQLYVGLDWERHYRKRYQIKEEKLNYYSEIFDRIFGRPDPYLIFVLGEPGCGKTTFSKKIALDWANEDEGLKRFDLVFVLPVRMWKGDESLAEFVWREVLKKDSAVNPAMLYEEIKKSGQKTLIILDGLDEINKYPIDVQNIVNKEDFTKNKVVVTTRPIGKDTMMQADVTTVIRGFEPEGEDKYLRKFFADDDKMYEGCKSEIEKKGLLGISKTPLLLHLLCILYNENKTLPSTVTGIYDKLENFVKKRFKSVMKEKNELVDENHMDDLLKTLCELAYKGTLTGQLIFEDGALKDRRELFALGFLSSWRIPGNTGGQSNFTFIHKTFQEYFSAQYIVKNIEDCNEFLNYCDTEKKAINLQNLLKFCCGINGEKGYNILFKIQQKQVITDARELLDLQMQVLCELEEINIDISSLECYKYLYIDGDMHIPCIIRFMPKKIDLDDIHIHEFTPVSLTVSNKKDTSKQKSCQLSLHQLEEINMEQCTVDKAAFWSKDEKLSESASCSPSPTRLQILQLKYCTLNSDCLSALFSWPHFQHLTSLDLTGTPLSGIVGADAGKLWLQQGQLSLKTLVMRECGLKRSDMVGVANLVKVSSHLKMLNLFFNASRGEELNPILDVLAAKPDRIIVWIDVRKQEKWQTKLSQHDIRWEW